MRQPQPNGVQDPRPEERLAPLTVEQLALVRHLALEQGYSDSAVNGLVGWIIARQTGGPDTSAASTQARYRKMLRAILEGEGPGPEPITVGGAARGRTDSGRARLELAGALAGAGALALATASKVAVLAPPVILAPTRYVEQRAA